MDHGERIVAWVKFDGDEYHNFLYQTHDPKPSEVKRMKAEGWFPLVVLRDHGPSTDRLFDKAKGQDIEGYELRDPRTPDGAAGDWPCSFHVGPTPGCEMCRNEGGSGQRLEMPRDGAP